MVHHVCNWECRRKLRHPKRYNSECRGIQRTFEQEVRASCPGAWRSEFVHPAFIIPKRTNDWIPQLCVQIYTHPRISQSDFPVIRFVKRKSTKTKVMDNSNASTCGQANRPTKRQSTRDKRKRKQMESEWKKKRCGFIIFCNWECHSRLRHPKISSVWNFGRLRPSRPRSWTPEKK